MADLASSTKSLHDPNDAQNSPSNASIHSKAPLDTNGTTQQAPSIAPFEIEGTNVDEIEYPTGVKFLLVLMAACLSLILVGLDFSIIATAVPAITTHFKTIADVGWYYSA
jgi:hypothetical protein